VGHVDVLYLRGGTPFVTEPDHLLDGLLGALEDGLDAAVVEIADPAVEVALLGFVTGRRPEVHTLYRAGDVYVCSCPRWHVCHFQRRPQNGMVGTVSTQVSSRFRR